MVIYYFEAATFFFSFHNPITYLEAVMHKNMVGFKMDIVIYTEVGM